MNTVYQFTVLFWFLVIELLGFDPPEWLRKKLATAFTHDALDMTRSPISPKHTQSTRVRKPRVKAATHKVKAGRKPRTNG